MRIKARTIFYIGALSVLVLHSFSAYADEQERDPFKSNITPVLTTSEGEQPIISALLQGISISDKKSFAIINDIIFYQDEEKSGIKVTKIKKKEVDILVNGIPQTLQMVLRDRPPAPPEGVISEEGVNSGAVKNEEKKPSGEEIHAL